MNPLELAAARSAWAHRNVGEKALLFIGSALLAVALPPIPGLPLLTTVIIGSVLRAHIPLKLYLRVCFAPMSFIIVGTLPLLLSITTRGVELHVSQWDQAATVVARSCVATSAVIAFAFTTPMAEIIAWSVHIGMPTSLVYVVTAMYRMINTLMTTARTMWEAQAMRRGHSSLRRWMGSVAAQAASLFIIAFDRARRLSEGLELRADRTALLVAHPRRQAHRGRLGCYSAALIVITALCFLYYSPPPL
ncbi:MAG: cobalt ECF transporter T component CbiQ [Corynebacterium sp.]|uniref:cobalt ECF transporter T component CbiQ n=1 Tax=Corynebacterium sp. TaxID=1720 RepID=UPI0026DDBBB0|nr:cobalt ECF transporter T component CbiQ [Corynebacterium sp.]MDO4761004.1 cobalt ECF transporter T component CbiQ [Corynebacterium sp.]